jgi:hypothetical protein
MFLTSVWASEWRKRDVTTDSGYVTSIIIGCTKTKVRFYFGHQVIHKIIWVMGYKYTYFKTYFYYRPFCKNVPIFLSYGRKGLHLVQGVSMWGDTAAYSSSITMLFAYRWPIKQYSTHIYHRCHHSSGNKLVRWGNLRTQWTRTQSRLAVVCTAQTATLSRKPLELA